MQDTSTCKTTGGYLYCQVCIFWNQGRYNRCPKDVTNTLSHTCRCDSN